MKYAIGICIWLSAAWAQGPVMSAVTPSYEAVKANFVEAALAMPEEDYSFKLTPAQRAFGEWVDHTAGMNLRMCAAMKGQAAPAPVAGDKSKAALVKALKESFDYCDATYNGMTDEAALQGKTLSLIVQQIANLNGHYGNMVGYLRTKGIVPPSTARAAKK
jgi:hypothetical protein